MDGGNEAQMGRGTMMSTLALGVALVACGGSPRFQSHGGMTVPASAEVMDPMPLVVEAHAAQARDPHRAFVLLAQACEVGHSVDACIEAESHNPIAGRPLIVHGCALGSTAACKILVKSEMVHEHKAEAAAREDVDHMLEMGCAQGVATACVTRSDLEGSLFATAAPTAPGRVQSGQNHHAVEVCVATCQERRTSCARRCELEGWETCPPASECVDEERTCDTGCQANAVLTCAVDLRGACGPLT